MQDTPATPSGAALRRTSRWGIWLSVACAVHCLALPVLAAAAPAMASEWAMLEGFDYVFVLTSLGLVFLQLWPAARRHGSWTAVRFCLAGVGVSVLAILTEGTTLAGMHLPLALAGSGLVITGFATNFRMRHRADCAC